MKDIISSISPIYESGISNAERSYREFCGMLAAHGLAIDDICVKETPRHNWNVMKGGKKVFLVSRYILSEEIIEKFKIKKCEE